MVGRNEEIQILRSMLDSSESEFVAMIGRRRVGKTYLIRNAYENQITFELTGIQYASLGEQLSNFNYALNTYFQNEFTKEEKPKHWIEAFQILI